MIFQYRHMYILYVHSYKHHTFNQTANGILFYSFMFWKLLIKNILLLIIQEHIVDKQKSLLEHQMNKYECVGLKDKEGSKKIILQ